jgi:two-component system chemotaxis response regulator CheY
MKCLVVDPSPTARRTLVRILRDAGFEAVLTADSPAETRRVLESDDGRGVDLILSEYDLPGESGVDLARGLPREGERTVPPLMLLTARNGREDVTRAAEAGVSGYVLKPIDPEVLGARIEAILGPLPAPAESGGDADEADGEAPAESEGEAVAPESAEAIDDDEGEEETRQAA